MVARYAGASLGLFAFGVAVIAGLSVRNPPMLILSRGVLALFVFFFLGLALGGAAQLVLREYQNRRETEIRQRMDTRKAAVADESADVTSRSEGISVGA